MRLSDRAIGLELTPLGWRAVHLEARLSSTRLIGSVEGDSEGSNPESARDALERAVRSLEVDAGTRLGIALARPIVHLKRIALPRASRSEIVQAVHAQAPSIFAVGKQAVIADVRSVSGNRRQRMAAAEGVVVAAPALLMEAIAQCSRTLGLRLSSADLSAGGVRVFLRRGTERVGLLHEAGLEWVRYGRDRAVEASRYFPFAAIGGPGAGAPQAMAGLPEVVGEEIRAARAVLLGPEELLRSLRSACKEDGSALHGAQLARRGISGLDQLQFTAACGAALQALGARRAFDLRPDWARQGDVRASRRRRGILLSLFVFSTALYGLSAIYTFRSQVGGLEHAVATLRPQAEEILTLRQAMMSAIERADLLARLELTQPRWTSVLAELAGALPTDAYLTMVSADGEGLRLEGYAFATSTVVGVLERSEVFDSVRLAGPVTRERTPLGERERFTLDLLIASGRYD